MLQIIAAAALLLSFLLPLLYYGDLPDQIPQHFNFAGEADIWGSKEIIWGIPLVNLFLFALIAFSIHKIKKMSSGRLSQLSLPAPATLLIF